MKAALLIPEHIIISEDKLKRYRLEEKREYRARMRLWSCPDISLLTIAGMMPSYFDITYIDLNFEKLPDSDFDIVFMSPSTTQALRAYELADHYRAKGTLVVMGGVHVSVMSEEALQYSDVVFVGESEDTFPKFINDLSNKELCSLYKNTEKPCLLRTPTPRYDLIKKYDYKSIPVQLSRGCPHQCDFCLSSAIYGKQYRKKSFDQVMKELDFIRELWPNNLVFFTDDNMFINEAFTIELMDYLQKKRIRWYAFSDAAIAEKPDLLEKMRNAGCYQLLIGFESLDVNNLAQINKSKWKKNKRADYKKIISIIQGYGIGVVGSFVLGLDEDNEKVFENLFKFILDSNMFATNITVLTPFPGTAVYMRLREEKRIISEDWSIYNGFELTFRLKNMTNEAFEKGFAELLEQLDSQERISRMINTLKTNYLASLKHMV